MLARIVSIITPVILIILVGWLYGRKAHPDMAGINRATLDVIAPLLVVSAFVSKDFVLADQFVLLACAIAVVLGSGVLAWVVARALRVDPRTFVPPMMFNNCGNMGLPLSVFAFGPAGLAPAVALFAASNLMHFTIGMKIVNRHASIAQIARNPMVLATVAGVGLSLARPWFALPEPVYQSIKLLGDATVPLMLFALGVRMKDVSLRNWGMGLVGAVACPLTGIAWRCRSHTGADDGAAARLAVRLCRAAAGGAEFPGGRPLPAGAGPGGVDRAAWQYRRRAVHAGGSLPGPALSPGLAAAQAAGLLRIACLGRQALTTLSSVSIYGPPIRSMQ